MAIRTPLYDWHVAHGARMVDFAGWDMPIQYGSIIEEHQAVRTSAGLFDVSHMGRLLFEGPDALDLIQHIFTNDPASMKIGQVRYGLICNEQGGVLDDVLLYRFEKFWLMVVNASNRDKIVSWIEKHRGGRQVQMMDMTSAYPMVAIQGPKAVDTVRTFLASDSWKTVAEGGPVEETKYYFSRIVWVHEADGFQSRLLVSRTGYTGEDGFEIIFFSEKFRDRLPALMANLMKAAQQVGYEMKPCGLGARDTLRLEAGMPLYGHELSEEIDPLQAGLAWAVKMDKGDFIGRDALYRRRQDPTLRQRVGLELEGKRLAREGSLVLQGGKEVGKVTSGTFAPTLAKAIAMAYVDRSCTAPGTSVEVDVRGKPAPAKVVPLPFYRRPK